jgi:hypothetical protein
LHLAVVPAAAMDLVQIVADLAADKVETLPQYRQLVHTDKAMLEELGLTALLTKRMVVVVAPAELAAMETDQLFAAQAAQD